MSTVDYGMVVNQKQGLAEISTDPLDRVTLTERDGLKRTRQITVGTNLLAAQRKNASTFYASTGLVFRVTDALNRVTETEYDAVGRSVKTWQSDPISGLIDRTLPNDPLLVHHAAHPFMMRMVMWFSAKRLAKLKASARYMTLLKRA